VFLTANGEFDARAPRA